MSVTLPAKAGGHVRNVTSSKAEGQLATLPVRPKAMSCNVTPKAAGHVTLRISRPKARLVTLRNLKAEGQVSNVTVPKAGGRVRVTLPVRPEARLGT